MKQEAGLKLYFLRSRSTLVEIYTLLWCPKVHLNALSSLMHFNVVLSGRIPVLGRESNPVFWTQW